MPSIARSSLSLLLFLLASASLAQTPPPAGPPFRVGGEVTRPEKIAGAPPVYTVEARKARITGVVILEAVIDEQGNVTDVKVLKGLPGGLDQSAMEAVRTWKFNPATLDGRPVEANPDFRDQVLHKRFGEALALLEERDAGPEGRLARVYVLSAMRRLDEAWEEAQAYDGPEPYEAFHQVAFAALNAAAGTLDEKARAAFLDVGLQAATQAMDAREGDRQAMITKSQSAPRESEAGDRSAARGAALRGGRAREAGRIESVTRRVCERIAGKNGEAVRGWKFKPATRAGRPVPVSKTGLPPP